jgi:hypothetical protein
MPSPDDLRVSPAPLEGVPGAVLPDLASAQVKDPTLLPVLTPRASVGVGLLVLAMTGIGDFITGRDVPFDLFYLVPVAAVTWHAGIGPGMRMSFLGTAAWALALGPLFADVGATLPWSPLPWTWNFTVRVAVLSVMAWLLNVLRQELVPQHRVAVAFQGTLDPLRGTQPVLVVCTSCHEVRSEEGPWMPWSLLLRERRAAVVVGGTCPGCGGTSAC